MTDKMSNGEIVEVMRSTLYTIVAEFGEFHQDAIGLKQAIAALSGDKDGVVYLESTSYVEYQESFNEVTLEQYQSLEPSRRRILYTQPDSGKDGERYRWLRDKSAGQFEHVIVVSQQKREQGMRYFGPVTGTNLDKAIDAAIKESGA